MGAAAGVVGTPTHLDEQKIQSRRPCADSRLRPAYARENELLVGKLMELIAKNSSYHSTEVDKPESRLR